MLKYWVLAITAKSEFIPSPLGIALFLAALFTVAIIAYFLFKWIRYSRRKGR